MPNDEPGTKRIFPVKKIFSRCLFFYWKNDLIVVRRDLDLETETENHDVTAIVPENEIRNDGAHVHRHKTVDRVRPKIDRKKRINRRKNPQKSTNIGMYRQLVLNTSRRFNTKRCKV